MLSATYGYHILNFPTDYDWYVKTAGKCAINLNQKCEVAKCPH